MNKQYRHLLITFLAALTLLAACHSSPEVDALKRSKVDAMNKVSFQHRFSDAAKSEQFARKALSYIHDSLLEYNDGKLRAWNNLAVSFSNRAMHDSAMCYVDSVVSFAGKSKNGSIERVLAKLVESRIRQRNSDIAGSYQILYDIESSGFLDRSDGSMLYNLAVSQFYITTTILNYHYRSQSQYSQSGLLGDMEAIRPALRCDFAEDMNFNYALAYGYYSLCEDTLHQPENLAKALTYCFENLRLLSDGGRYSTFHLADTYQLIGIMLWSRRIKSESWERNYPMLDEMCALMSDSFGFNVSRNPADSANSDLCHSFLREATALFFLHDDPYQRLGALVATGRYCMYIGDTLSARNYFLDALSDTTLLGVSPKFEAMLYEGLLTSGCAESLDEVAKWTGKELAMLDIISKNERADFKLQQQLNQAHRFGFAFFVVAILLFALASTLTLTLFILRRRTKALERETASLQAAKRQDVERIANVETCLSVLRHDITPFVSYLQNDNLPDELKREVTGQLIRTFENIKNWTNLSIPGGLRFACSNVSLQDVFQRVKECVNNFRGDDLVLTFHPTTLMVRGDGQLLEIMIRNLVNNAIQHTTSGTVDVSAEVFTDDNRFVHVSVADTGCGMSSDELENLFRTDKKMTNALKNRNNGVPEADNDPGYGSGFGLILCRYIVKKHDDNTLRGCRIWAESQEGRGSTFHFIVAGEPIRKTENPNF